MAFQPNQFVGVNISIRKRLQDEDESLEILIRVAQVLIEGIARNVVASDPAACERFTEKMLDLASRFTENMPAGDALVQAGAAVRTLEDYTEVANLNLKTMRREVDTVIALLTQTVAVTSQAGSQSVRRLQHIEGELSKAKAISDIRVLKARLEDCLVDIREEAKRREHESEEVVSTLSREVKKFQTQPPASPPNAGRDGLTGLPTRDEGEKALSELCRSLRGFVAVLTLDRLHIYNGRYGRSVGDGILRFYAEKMKELSPGYHQLFRWSGPTLMVVSHKVMSVDDARSEIKRVQEKIPAFELALETRSATLALTSRWAVFPAIASFSTLLRKIDMFATIQVAGGNETEADAIE